MPVAYGPTSISGPAWLKPYHFLHETLKDFVRCGCHMAPLCAITGFVPSHLPALIRFWVLMALQAKTKIGRKFWRIYTGGLHAEPCLSTYLPGPPWHMTAQASSILLVWHMLHIAICPSLEADPAKTSKYRWICWIQPCLVVINPVRLQ